MIEHSSFFDFVKYIGHNKTQEKIRNRRGLSRNQLLAYRDFQNNFNERLSDAKEIQMQLPASKQLTKKELTNLYSVHIKGKFTAKEFTEATSFNKNTSRREIASGVRRGLIEKIPRKHAQEAQEYRYK